MNPTPEQQHAIDESGSNIIVSAGAGSGKTAVLTRRTMRILNEGTHINELLILTFTKAAAAEMKNRIRKAIKKESANNEKLIRELELIDQSYITTFDSYALSVVKKYHYLLNLPNDIGISDSSIIDMQKIKIMNEVFDNNYQNPSEEFTKLIYDFCVKDDRDIKEQITKIATKIDGFPNREEYLSTYEEKYLSDTYIEELLLEYNNILNITISEIEDQYKTVSSYADGNYSAKLIDSLMPLFNAKTLNEIYNISETIKLPSLPRGSEDELKEEKDKLNEMIKSLKETLSEFGSIDEIKNNLKESYTYTKAIINIIREYLTKLHNYKKENELYDFQDIALLSIDILKQNESVREEIKESFKEIMIDEYQDTNDIQETFISMIENNNVYMVGDVKQSIYRFRNANPYIFKNKYDNYSNGNGGVKIDLVKNFRSRDEVLKNINDIFELLMDDKIGGADYSKSHKMKFGFEDYIKKFFTKNNHDIRILEYEPDESKKYSNDEIEIFSIVKDIKDKINNKFQVFDKDEEIIRDIKYKDMVILIDRSNSFDLFKKIFEYNAIPLTIYRDEKLTNSDDIYILKNIVNYIIKLSKKEYDKEFEYALTSIARSYLFNMKDQDIFNMFINKEFNNNEIYKVLSPISESLNNKDITTIVEEIITNTNMYENIIKISNIETTNKRISILLDIATNLNNLGYDIYSFRDYLNEILDNNYQIKYKEAKRDTDSVKIMTIHNSKGLEYPICYFPGLNNEFNFRELNDRFLLDNKYGIITPLFKEGIYDLISKYIVKYHYKEEEISEKIRLFYVALTRAREQIIMLTPTSEDKPYSYTIVPDSVRRKYKSFKSIMESIKFKLKKYYEPINYDDINLTKDYIYNKYKENNLTNSSNTFKVEELIPKQYELQEEQHFSKTTHELITKETKENMKFGLKIHETLEYLDFINPNLDIIDNTYIKNKIKKFLTLPIIFNLNDAKIYKEYEFIYNENFIEYHGIIDLMIEREDRIDIIDYKLNNIKDDNYLKQLNGYKKYIETLSSKKVNIYLYSIINEQIEEL